MTDPNIRENNPANLKKFVFIVIKD